MNVTDDKRLRRWRGALRVLLVGFMTMIFLFSTQDGDRSSDTSGPFTRFVLSIVRPDFGTLPAFEQQEVYDTADFIVQKCAHFTEYALLGLLIELLVRTHPWHRRVYSWLFGTLYAASDELHQLFVSARSAMWQDVVLDSAGVLVGVLLGCVLMTRWIARHGSIQPKDEPNGP